MRAIGAGEYGRAEKIEHSDCAGVANGETDGARFCQDRKTRSHGEDHSDAQDDCQEGSSGKDAKSGKGES